MKSSLVLLATLATVQAFAPQRHHATATTTTSLQAMGQDENNYIPPNNNWFPKHNKCLVGDFYGELNTQKELKVPKDALEQMERPEVVMMNKEQQARTGYTAPPATPVPPANTGPQSAVGPTGVVSPASLE